MDISQTLSHFRNKYSQSNSDALRNPWVIAMIALVLTFLTVNAVFIVLAIVTNPGLVVEDYYEHGRSYERNAFKKLAAQSRMQWDTRLDLPADIIQNLTDSYRFSAVDQRGLPIQNAEVQMIAYRPSDAAADLDTTMKQIAPGIYEAELSLPLPGVWDIKVLVRDHKDEYELRQRVNARASSVSQ